MPDAPDAGRLLQEQRTIPAPPVEREGLRVEPSQPEVAEPGGAKIKLEKLIFSGNTVFTDAQLTRAAGKIVGNEFDLAGLQKIAERIASYYRDRGYIFVRVVLPPQKIGTGKVRFEIIEGRYGDLRAVGETSLAAKAQKWLVPLGENSVIRASELERATLLLSDLPGIATQPVIRPGLKVGTGDLDVAVAALNKYDFNVGLDNHGSRYSGYYRARANLAVNSPAMLGDQLLIGLVRSDDNLSLGNINYSLPVGANGLRAQFGLAYTSYQLGKELAALQRSGNALVGQTGLSYSLIRSNSANLMLATSVVRKNFTDITGTASAEKFTNSIPVSLQFDVRDQLFGPAITFGSLVFTYGSLSDVSLRTAGAINREGAYKKLNLDLIRQQQLSRDVMLSVRTSMQGTSDNLDSSEDFVLGGPTGIRAYPTGEAAGDRGWLAQIELQRRLGSALPYVFYDRGAIDTNARVVGSNSFLPKQRAGAGIGIRYETGKLRTDAIIARRTSSTLAESDLSHPSVQAWLTMAYRY